MRYLDKNILKKALPFIVVFLILVAIMPRRVQFNYNYKIGSIWKYETLKASMTFPIHKSKEQFSKESRKKIFCYSKKDQVEKEILAKFDAKEMAISDSSKLLISRALKNIYQQGIIAESELNNNLEGSDIIYLQKAKQLKQHPKTELYTRASARDAISHILQAVLEEGDIESFLSMVNIEDYLKENIFYNQELSQAYNQDDEIAETKGYVKAGEIIVYKNDILSREIVEKLDSYKKALQENIQKELLYNLDSEEEGYSLIFYLIKLWLSNIFIAASLVVLLFFAMYYTYSKILNEFNSLIYILLIFLLFSIVTFIIEKINYELLYMVPFTLPALYMQAFFKRRLILPISVITMLPLLIFAHNGLVLFMIFILAQVIGIYLFSHYSKGWLQFVSAAIICISSLLIFLGFAFAGMVHDQSLYNLLYLVIGAFLTVAAYPLIYLFERMFNLLSNNRLMELADTNNKLLHDLEAKAPGTFQHSLQVMNMADYVARAVEANALLVRVGALYHDIGKMNNPLCFIENESLIEHVDGKPYHQGMDPRESAKDIIKHVTDGVELADKYGIPNAVKDFILSHHGTSVTGYFYNKYINEGGNPENIQDFIYPGKKPQTKEQVILMLCDSVEAASRTLKNHNSETFSEFVEAIVSAKMRAGQFEDSEISIKDFNKVKEKIKSYLAQIYHERVVYPKAKRKLK